MKTAVNILMITTVCCSAAMFCGCTQERARGSLATGSGQESVVRIGDVPITEAPWGTLQWLVSGEAGSSSNMTLGRVVFKPGQQNPPHYHPKSEEILYVVSGRLEHTLPEGGTTILKAGDSIILPSGTMHYAKNVGTKDAVVIVVFDNAYRQALGE